MSKAAVLELIMDLYAYSLVKVRGSKHRDPSVHIRSATHQKTLYLTAFTALAGKQIGDHQGARSAGSEKREAQTFCQNLLPCFFARVFPNSRTNKSLFSKLYGIRDRCSTFGFVLFADTAFRRLFATARLFGGQDALMQVNIAFETTPPIISVSRRLTLQ